MAVTLDFNLICVHYFDPTHILQNNDETYSFTIENVFSIDNWMWENQKELKDNDTIEKYLTEGKIIVINLTSSKFKDCGIYVEQINNEYCYNFWINTDGFPELDCDFINEQNIQYFEEIYSLFDKILLKEKLQYKVLAIGIETVFFYDKNINNIFTKSRNVISWIINKKFINNVSLKEYQLKKYNGQDAIIYEKHS